MDPRKEFIKQLRRYQKGSISRRHFLGVTGLGTAMAVMAAAVPTLRPRKAWAPASSATRSRSPPGRTTTTRRLDAFAAQTGCKVELTVFGSNEEMYAKLKAGGTGWDVFVPTNYTIENYVTDGIIEPLDLAQIPNYDPSTYTDRFTEPGTIDGTVYAVPKNWGTTGFVVNTPRKSRPPGRSSWIYPDKYSGRTMVHDYQLTTIGNALSIYGYSFNSNDEKELAEAEKLLLEVKPHLFAINSDYQPACATATPCSRWPGPATASSSTRTLRDHLRARQGRRRDARPTSTPAPKEAPNKKAAMR